jgi:hypothetical protein
LAAAEPRHETAFTLQADLTATVVGRLAREVLTELRLLADVESTGAATTFRFSEGSLRRAFDAGRSSAEITSFLERHAAKGVPQPLAYLVGDVARRHGHLRVGDAGSFVTSDDPAVLADACTHRRTRKLALHLLAPTVAVSPRPPDAVLEGLRAAGFLPTADALDGTLEIAAQEPVEESPAHAAGGESADEPLPERFPARRAQRAVVDETTARELAAEILAAPSADTTQFGGRRRPPSGQLALAVDVDSGVDDAVGALGDDDLFRGAVGTRVLAVALGDDDDSEPLIVVPSSVEAGRIVGFEVVDQRTVSIQREHITAVIDLGEIGEFVGRYRGPASRPARRRSARRRR